MARQGQYHFESMRIARGLAVAAGVFVTATVLLIPRLAEAGGFQSLGLAVGLCAVTLGLLFAAFDRAPDAGWLFEYETRRKFKAVCEQKRLTGTDSAGRTVYPRMSRLMGGHLAWNVRVHPLLGQSLADWERASDALQMALGVVGVRFSDNGDGTITMRAGYQRLAHRDFVPPPPEPVDDGQDWRERLASVVVGFTEMGRPYALPLLDSHVLIAGITGSGKGSVIWSLVLGLRTPMHAGVVRFWGFDGKRMELSIGRNIFGDRYASDPVGMVELLERAAAEMLERADGLAGKVRRFDPSVVHPLNVLVVDELAYLASMLPDRKLRERADTALSNILIFGRAIGYVVVGALQDPRKETLGFRDLFPTRVAMRLSKPMVDLVLGSGAHEAGALCDLIPSDASGKGVGFVLGEGSMQPECVRMTWCSDQAIADAAASLAPPPVRPRLAS